MALQELSTNRKTLGIKAYQAIRDEIISLQIKPGEMIYENGISAQLGVSRTPVREAFNMLLKDELIEILPQKGAQVALISQQKVAEAQYVRECLEVSTFKIVASMWNSKEAKFRELEDEINNIINQQEQAVAEQNYVSFVALDGQFHEKILSVIENRTVLVVMNQMRAHLNRMRYLELLEARHEQIGIDQHKEIFAAIRANDPSKTEILLAWHLRILDDVRPDIIKKYSHFFKES
ncbi:GntR family transcriptional regulator [Paenibacillus marchantiophytorum]|uniref:GntR family transcriptional regulator n=1 Tax=Paenibacillus marchantiophytorum TaxID=1619310 RepID=A0ABQ2BTT9_9BACL|nr:GntR family transcriptional regulator [Paenibacillus marchantiophytorum]GGI45658.1 GntR family transcriptional regulator [Paenibacillus marchantiophytorum]